MILIIRQVTKVNRWLSSIDWLRYLIVIIILTSCNSYLKTKEQGSYPETPDDTLFLSQTYDAGKWCQTLADLGRIKSLDQSIRVYSEKAKLFHERVAYQLDSLSKRKGFSIDNSSPDRRKTLQKFSKLKPADFEYEYFHSMENSLQRQVKLLEDVSRNSEDNEISTFAIILLPEIHSQLDSLIELRNKISDKR